MACWGREAEQDRTQLHRGRAQADIVEVVAIQSQAAHGVHALHQAFLLGRFLLLDFIHEGVNLAAGGNERAVVHIDGADQLSRKFAARLQVGNVDRPGKLHAQDAARELL